MKQQLQNCLIVLVLLLSLSACGPPPPPKKTSNICHIFAKYPDWYQESYASQRRWGVPIYVQLAIIHQESRFNGDAKPPRTRLLWVIPWFRKSSAYGYAQVKDDTWQDYKKATGSHFVSRDAFGDAADFIGWYGNMAHRRAGISTHDAYRLYLAYHEGVGGYLRQTYVKKRWLINVAHKVSRRAKIYHTQLKTCADKFKKSWYQFW